MLSLNELSTSINDFDISVPSNLSHKQKRLNPELTESQGNSRQLFRKCKQIIQEQMLQIKSFSQQNDTLRQQLQKSQQQGLQLQNKTQHITAELNEVKIKNQLLHKEINRLNLIIEEMNQKSKQKDNLIKLTQNKVELLQSSIHKATQQQQIYKQKCTILQQTIELLQQQNKKADKVLIQKELEIKSEIQELKKIKNILERRNKIEEIDFLVQKRLNSQQRNNYLPPDKSSSRPQFAIDQNPFRSVELNRYGKFSPYSLNSTQLSKSRPQITKKDQIYPHFLDEKLSRVNNSRVMKSFSIVDERPSTSPVSRIRKNTHKSRVKHGNEIKKQDQNSLLSLSNIQKSRKKKNISRHEDSLINPEVEFELSSIKKQILEQYNKIELKREAVNHQRINQTLEQIEHKLQKMTKISGFDESESQFE